MFNYTTLDDTKVEYVEIAPASEVPNGERLFVDLGDKPVVIFNIAGQFFAIGDVCTHDDGLICDRHECDSLDPGEPHHARHGQYVYCWNNQ